MFLPDLLTDKAGASRLKHKAFLFNVTHSDLNISRVKTNEVSIKWPKGLFREGMNERDGS